MKVASIICNRERVIIAYMIIMTDRLETTKLISLSCRIRQATSTGSWVDEGGQQVLDCP